MIGTIISILIALIFYFNQQGMTIADGTTPAIIFSVVAGLFLLIETLILTLTWAPMQIAEQYTTPRLFDLFKKDNYLFLSHLWLIFFPLITFIFVIYITAFNVFSKSLLPLWIVMLGISLDAIYFSIKRVYNYLNPFHVTTLFTKEATRSIQNDQELDLCHWVDGLAEMAIRAVQRTSIALTHEVINALQGILRIFFASSKSISHPEQDSQTKALGVTDKVSYVLFFVLQRLEMINDKIVGQKLEPSASYLIMALGKIVISAGKCDITLINHPLHYLGRFAIKAQRQGLAEVGPKATCTILEVAKTLLSEIDITYLDLKEPFFTLTAQLEEISKEMFRQDKTISFSLLKQPFLVLKELFKSEKVVNHQDTPAIVENIDRILGDFAALEAVMRTIPPIPKVATENGMEI
jgi:hypothetical protein